MLYIAHNTIHKAAIANKYERGVMLAKSLKEQKHSLNMANTLIKKKQPKLAQQWIDEWKKQRQAFKMAYSWQIH